MSGTILPNIAFIGRAGSGKTTCREILEKQFGYERLSFAAPLKVGCATTTDRHLLQTVGHGVRELFEDFWVNLLIETKQSREFLADPFYDGKPWPKFAVDDCRYPNEARALKAEGFIVVRVVAPKVQRLDRLRLNGRLQDEAQLDHISETALDDFDADYRIVNDGWPDELAGRLTDIINRERS